MATGKTVNKYVVVKMDNAAGAVQIITASVSKLGALGKQFDAPDVTTFADGWKNFLIAMHGQDVDLEGPFNNTATTGAHIIFSGIVGLMSATFTFAAVFGVGAAGTTGDPQWSGEYYCAAYTVEASGPQGALMWKAKLKPAGTTAGDFGTA